MESIARVHRRTSAEKRRINLAREVVADLRDAGTLCTLPRGDPHPSAADAAAIAAGCGHLCPSVCICG